MPSTQSTPCLLDSGIHVEIMLPLSWWHKPYYKLLNTVECAGHIVPVGFISDGATVPRILWPIFPTIGRYLKATLVHDYYLTEGIDRKTCDHRFRDCLVELGIESWRVNAMFYAVRVYGIIKDCVVRHQIPQ